MKIILNEGTQVEAQFRGFSVLTDQPETAGGQNAAPSPFDLFLASIGTCAGFYVQAFCRKREISMDGIELEMSFTRNDETRLIDRIQIDVDFPSTFPKKYIDACIKSAEQCTVKKHLQVPPSVVVRPRTG